MTDRYGPNHEAVISFLDDVANLSQDDVTALTLIGRDILTSEDGDLTQDAWAKVARAAEDHGLATCWQVAVDDATTAAERWTLGRASGFLYVIRDAAVAIMMEGQCNAEALSILANGWDSYEPDFGEEFAA
jgi:hypothetical protein